MDDFVERNVSTILVVIGVLMVVGAAFLNMADGLAIAFAVLGVGLVTIGGLARLLVGRFEITLQGIKGEFAVRRDRVLAIAAEEASPAEAAAIGDVLAYTEESLLRATRAQLGELGAAMEKTGGAASERSARVHFEHITEDDVRRSLRHMRAGEQHRTAGAAVPERSSGSAWRTRGAADPETADAPPPDRDPGNG